MSIGGTTGEGSCASCGKVWSEHDGIQRTCAALKKADARIDMLTRELNYCVIVFGRHGTSDAKDAIRGIRYALKGIKHARQK